MICKYIVPLIGVLFMVIHTNGQDVETNNIVENDSFRNEETTAVSESVTTEIGQDNDVVTIQLYYECLCPDCRKFDTQAFKQTVLDLSPYLDIYLYPYGNARTINNGGGNYSFMCQHGPAECYGNKLHACAIDVLQNVTLAVLYNSCLMDYSQVGKGSDDAAADVCGLSMSMNSEAIKKCAKGDRGSELLKLYGDESKKAGFESVPHILINGTKGRDDHFKDDVCKAFKYPPRQCRQ